MAFSWESLGGRPTGVGGSRIDRQIRCEQSVYLQMVGGRVGGPIVCLPSYELVQELASTGSPAASFQSFSTIVFFPGKLPPIWRTRYQLNRLLPNSNCLDRIELKPSSGAPSLVSCLVPRSSEPTPKSMAPKQLQRKPKQIIQKSIASKIFLPRR
jgi:hypothetical protein